MSKQFLIETIDFVPTVCEWVDVPVSEIPAELVNDTEVDESTKTVKKLEIEGVFQRAETVNRNKRVYPRSLWERLLDPKGPAMRAIGSNGMWGMLEHPKDGIGDIGKAAILTTSLRLTENNEVIGRARVLSTSQGRELQSLIADEVKLGISSRGRGTTNEKGIVQEDFELLAFDVVGNPSTIGAEPRPVAAASSNSNKTHTEAVTSNSVIEEEGNMSGTNLTSQFQALENKANAIFETDFSTASSFDVNNASSQLLEMAREAGEIKRNDPALSESADDLARRLAEYRRTITSSTSKKSVNEDENGDDDEDDFIDDSLFENMDDGDDEEDALRQLLGIANDALRDANQRVVELQEKLEASEALIEELAESEGDDDAEPTTDGVSSKQYDAAISMIQALNARTHKRRVRAAVKEAVRNNPALAGVVNRLEECTTADAVRELADDLGRITPQSKSRRHPELPPSGKMLESAGSDISENLSGLSRQHALASKAARNNR